MTYDVLQVLEAEANSLDSRLLRLTLMQKSGKGGLGKVFNDQDADAMEAFFGPNHAKQKVDCQIADLQALVRLARRYLGLDKDDEKTAKKDKRKKIRIEKLKPEATALLLALICYSREEKHAKIAAQKLDQLYLEKRAPGVQYHAMACALAKDKNATKIREKLIPLLGTKPAPHLLAPISTQIATTLPTGSPLPPLSESKLGVIFINPPSPNPKTTSTPPDSSRLLQEGITSPRTTPSASISGPSGQPKSSYTQLLSGIFKVPGKIHQARYLATDMKKLDLDNIVDLLVLMSDIQNKTPVQNAKDRDRRQAFAEIRRERYYKFCLGSGKTKTWQHIGRTVKATVMDKLAEEKKGTILSAEEYARYDELLGLKTGRWYQNLFTRTPHSQKEFRKRFTLQTVPPESSPESSIPLTQTRKIKR